MSLTRLVNKMAKDAQDEIQRKALLARLELQRLAERHNRSRGQLFRRDRINARGKA